MRALLEDISRIRDRDWHLVKEHTGLSLDYYNLVHRSAAIETRNRTEVGPLRVPGDPQNGLDSKGDIS